MEDRIVRDITIDAPLDRVWDLVTEPGWWVPSDVQEPADRTPGSRSVRASENHGRFPVEVVGIDPRAYVAFRWASRFPGEELAPGRTTLVESAVAEVDGGVRVTVTESGFASLDAPEEVRADALRDNAEGWEIMLGELRVEAEKA